MPDEQTIWKFQNDLVQANVHKKLFAQLEQQMCAQGLLRARANRWMRRQVETPRTQMSKEERKQVKEGKVPPEWSKAKSAQLDCDARWTVITMPGKTDKDGKKN